MVSTSHCILCFAHLTEDVPILWCILRATKAKHHNIHTWVSEASDSMVQNHWVGASPGRGTPAHTDGYTEEQSTPSSALRREAMGISANETAASAALPDRVKSEAMILSSASAAGQLRHL